MDLSRDLRVIMSHAYNKAREDQNEYLMPEHILYSIVKNNEEIVDKLNIDQEEMLGELDIFFKTKVPSAAKGANPIESMGFNQVVQASVQQVENSQRDTVEISDVLVAIFMAKGQAQYILQKHNVQQENLMEVVSEVQRGESEEATAAGPAGRGRKKKSILDEFTVELVAEAKAGNLDPIIGRTDEIERTVQILCRKKKNNPIHVGEPGVGKCLHSDENVDLLVSDEMYGELKEFI